MPSNIYAKNPDLLRFHSPRIKLKKTDFFKGSRGISPLKKATIHVCKADDFLRYVNGARFHLFRDVATSI